MNNKLSTTIILGSLMALGSISTAFAAAGLTTEQAGAIFLKCKEEANQTPSAFRGAGNNTKMWCAVVNREGTLKLIKATDTDESPKNIMITDAWRVSIEVAIAKAFSGIALSSDQNAVTSRDLGTLSQPGQPLWGIGNTNPYRPLTGNKPLKPDDEILARKHHGIVTFPGGVPVYTCDTHKLVGGVGVSGDSVDNDETVAEGAVTGAGFCLTP